MMLCLRLMKTVKYVSDLVDQAEMGKEAIRYYFREVCVDVKAIYWSVF